MNWLSEHVPPNWSALAREAMNSPAWSRLEQFLQAELASGQTIYPPQVHWFSALQRVAPQDVRVVIVGQDPYHGEGEAHGLSFSVPPGIRIPPSLANIFKEIARDLGHTPPQHGCLESWASQGVLLLNTSLTVRADQAGSHAKMGWEAFTDDLISSLAQEREQLVFLLWGSHAQKKSRLVDASRHLILQSPHPSPLSAYRGFIGNGHFSATNRYLEQNGLSAIDWQIN